MEMLDDRVYISLPNDEADKVYEYYFVILKFMRMKIAIK